MRAASHRHKPQSNRCTLTPPQSSKKWNNLDFQTFDSAYVERLRAGDPQTEGDFVSYFGELIVLKLRSRLATRQTMEDVKQETFARCLQLLRSEGGIRHA